MEKIEKVALPVHENVTFTGQVVRLAGFAYSKCTFDRCTLVVSNLPMGLKECKIQNCHFRFEYDILAGDRAATKNLKNIINLIDSSQSNPSVSSPLN